MSGPIRLVDENLTCSQKGYAMSIVVLYDCKSWMGHSCNDTCHMPHATYANGNQKLHVVFHLSILIGA
jgi:hypothetical protein